MRAFRPLIKIIPAAAALAALPALATDGYFPHGYGMKALGMGGTSTALAQDSLGGATNPASMVWAGSRMDIGANLFMPVRDAERSGAGFPTLNGKVDSDKPVGTVWFGWALRRGESLDVTAEHHLLPGDRDDVRRESVALALRGGLQRSVGD